MWKVEEVKELRGFTVEWAEDENYILSRRNTLFHSVAPPTRSRLKRSPRSTHRFGKHTPAAFV